MGAFRVQFYSKSTVIFFRFPYHELSSRDKFGSVDTTTKPAAMKTQKGDTR